MYHRVCISFHSEVLGLVTDSECKILRTLSATKPRTSDWKPMYVVRGGGRRYDVFLRVSRNQDHLAIATLFGHTFAEVCFYVTESFFNYGGGVVIMPLVRTAWGGKLFSESSTGQPLFA